MRSPRFHVDILKKGKPAMTQEHMKFIINYRELKKECKGSHDRKHKPTPKMGSKTGYICSCCRKEVKKTSLN